MRFEGKVAVVTGAGSGIGRTVSRMIAAEGGRVCVADIDEGAAATVAQAIGASAISLRLDVTLRDSWAAAVERAIARFGKINILVSNAGISQPGSVVNTSEENWRRNFAVHVDGLFYGVRACLPHMEASGEPGAFVTLGSLVASHPRANLAGYSVSKAAAVMLTKSVALDCAARGLPIRANCVHPGAVDTAMFRSSIEALPVEERERTVARIVANYPLGRIAHADEIARAILFLASDESSFTTGADLNVDGGAAIRE